MHKVFLHREEPGYEARIIVLVTFFHNTHVNHESLLIEAIPLPLNSEWSGQ